MVKTKTRYLVLLAGLAVFCSPTTTYGNRESTPTDCVWNNQRRTYTCDIVGVPNDIVIRRLRLSHLKISGNIHNVTANPEMKDIGISWNKQYITLFLQKGSQQREIYHLHIISIRKYTWAYRYAYTKYKTRVTIRPLDVQLVNLTETACPEGNHEVILQCSIVGLNTDETDYDITFYNLPKCEHYQKELPGESNDSYSITPTNNGTTNNGMELHVLQAKASQSGSYSCKVKLHKDEPEESVFAESLPMTVDIGHPPISLHTGQQSTTKSKESNDHANIIEPILGSTILIILGIIILVALIKCVRTKRIRKQPERVQQQEAQPEIDEVPPNPIAEQNDDEQNERGRLLAQDHGQPLDYGAHGDGEIRRQRQDSDGLNSTDSHQSQGSEKSSSGESQPPISVNLNV